MHHLDEMAYIPYLVRGLRNAEFRSALSRNPPQTVAALMQTISGMEAFQPASFAFLTPAAPTATTTARAAPATVTAPTQTYPAPLPIMPVARPVNAPAVTAAATTAMAPAQAAGALVPVPPRVTRRPPRDIQQMQCYGCGMFGHLNRDCPARAGQQQGNAVAGPAGQGRP